MHSLRERDVYGQARGESVARSNLAWRGRRADDASVSRIFDSVVMGCAVAAAAWNKHTTRTEMYGV